MIIRKATLDDADTLMNIERKSGYPLPQYFWDRGHYKKFIKNEIVFVAVDKKPIGFVLIKNKFLDGAEIDTIAVLKNYHGKDVAKKLLTKAERTIGKNKKVYVRCWNKNFPAIGFYNKNKYYVIAAKKRPYSGRETGLLMCKDL
jgi:ribosomal protein S18 acetylase RimI-like enzyme